MQQRVNRIVITTGFSLAVVSLIVLCSCTRKPKLDKLVLTHQTGNSNVDLEGRYWRSLYTQVNAFELTFTNKGDESLSNCMVTINENYKSELKGMLVKKNGVNKFEVYTSNEIPPGGSISIPFTKESGNLKLFKIKENIFFKPKTINLYTSSDTLEWNFEIPLRESYF